QRGVRRIGEVDRKRANAQWILFERIHAPRERDRRRGICSATRRRCCRNPTQHLGEPLLARWIFRKRFVRTQRCCDELTDVVGLEAAARGYEDDFLLGEHTDALSATACRFEQPWK